VTFASFLPDRVKIICHHSNRNCGARNIDFLLFDILASEFGQKHGVNPKNVTRSRLRMLDAIEKMRKILTLNKEADLQIDSLLDEIDFHRHFTRDQFEKLVAPVIQEFDVCLK
jgi:heat shock 70kDa protein 4